MLTGSLRRTVYMKRAFTNLLAKDPAGTAAFYMSILGMDKHADFGWFIILTHKDMPSLEFGILDRDHESVPEEGRATPSGVVLTFVVDDLGACHKRAEELGATIVEPPTDMDYGQRRLLLRDPEGTLVDISSPVAPKPEIASS